jgi:hypothetical protein
VYFKSKPVDIIQQLQRGAPLLRLDALTGLLKECEISGGERAAEALKLLAERGGEAELLVTSDDPALERGLATPFNELCEELAELIFWRIVALGAADTTPQTAAMAAYTILARPLQFTDINSKKHRARFDPTLGTYAQRALLPVLERRAMTDETQSADRRLAIVIARYPSGVDLLRGLVAASEALTAHAPALLPLILWEGYDAQRVLDADLLRPVWTAAAPITRAQVLGELAHNLSAQQRAGALGFGPIFAEGATPDLIAQLLPMSAALPGPDWATLALQLLSSPNPALREPAISLLAAQEPTRDALPALSAARAQAALQERRRIDAIIAGIRRRDPRPGDADGALSLAAEAEQVGAISLAAEAGSLSAPGEALTAAPASAVAAGEVALSRDALLARWRQVAPAPRRASWPLVLSLFVLGPTHRRVLLWSWLAVPALLSPISSLLSSGMFQLWLYGGAAVFCFVLATEKISAATARIALSKAPTTTAVIKHIDGGVAQLRLDDGVEAKIHHMGHLQEGDRTPVWRLARGHVIEVVALESISMMRLDADGMVRVRRGYLLAAILLPLLGAIGFLIGLLQGNI